MFIKTKATILKKNKLTKGKSLLTVFTKSEGIIVTSVYDRNKKNESAILSPYMFFDVELSVSPKKSLNDEVIKYKIVSVENIIELSNIAKDIKVFEMASNLLIHINKLIPSRTKSEEIFDLLFLCLTSLNDKKDKDFIEGLFYAKFLKIEGKLNQINKFSSDEIKIINFLLTVTEENIKNLKLENKNLLTKLRDEFIFFNY